MQRLVDEVAAQVEQQPAAGDRGSASRHEPARGSGRQRSNRDSYRSTSPSEPSAISRRSVSWSLSHRRFWNTVRTVPAASAACSTVAASPDVSAIGLSTTTALRCWIAVRASAA